MKITFEEYEHGTEINLVPESAYETAQLLRFTKNTKRKRATIGFSYSKSSLRCNVYFEKLSELKQQTYLSNGSNF